MNEKNDFALVPRPPGALKKADRGAKRIMSGMVGDTLALMRRSVVAKPVINLLLGFGSKERYEFFVEAAAAKIGAHHDLRFLYFENESELLRMSQQQSFDLAVVFCNHTIIDWRKHAEDSLKAVELMERVATQCRKPFFVLYGFDVKLTSRLKAAGVTTFEDPLFSTFAFWNAVQDRLKIPRTTPNDSRQVVLQHRVARPLRIVMLDDEPFVLDALKMMLQFDFNDATVLTFTDAEEALQELLLNDPDFFTTDSAHPGMRGAEMLRLLTTREAKYPVFVLSASAHAEDILLWGCHDRNVAFLPKPFLVEDLRKLIATYVHPPDNAQWKFRNDKS